MSFRLTYGTMFNPPEAIHERFEAALATMQGRLGATHPLFIGGRDHEARGLEQKRSPIGSELTLGRFPLAVGSDIEAAFAAAEGAFPRWRALPVSERAAALRRVADVMESRVYEIAAALVLEVGKNRMEALGETQETVDFFRYYADDFESHGGYDIVLLTNFLHHFDRPTCVGLLQKVHAALRPGGRAAALEFVPAEDRISPPMAAAFSMMMLATTVAGDAYTFQELAGMYRDAGFGDVAAHPVPRAPHTIVIGYKR